MSSPESIKLDPKVTVIFGKPSNSNFVDDFTKIAASFVHEEIIIEAHMPQYFVLGSMPAPRLSLVLVTNDVSQHANIALRARSLLENLSLAQPVTDVWIMQKDDKLLPSVRRANCQINLQLIK